MEGVQDPVVVATSIELSGPGTSAEAGNLSSWQEAIQLPDASARSAAMPVGSLNVTAG